MIWKFVFHVFISCVIEGTLNWIHETKMRGNGQEFGGIYSPMSNHALWCSCYANTQKYLWHNFFCFPNLEFSWSHKQTSFRPPKLPVQLRSFLCWLHSQKVHFHCNCSKEKKIAKTLPSDKFHALTQGTLKLLSTVFISTEVPFIVQFKCKLISWYFLPSQSDKVVKINMKNKCFIELRVWNFGLCSHIAATRNKTSHELR